MAVSWYHFNNCCAVIKQEGAPNTVGYPSGALHSWTKLVEAGSANSWVKL